MIGDRALVEFRQGYYGLFAALFAREPGPELLRSLGDGIDARVEASLGVSARLGEGWKELRLHLAGPEAAPRVAEEFSALFGGPRPALHPYESYYLTGRFYTEPLAAVRDFLRRARLAKSPEVHEPEDGLPFECEVMSRLVGRQAGAPNPDAEAESAHLQGEFLKHHLLVWVPQFAADLAAAGRAAFYAAVGKMLQGFLELEREVARPWGPEGFRSYEEAREAVTRRGGWRGPLFDPAAGPEGSPG